MRSILILTVLIVIAAVTYLIVSEPSIPIETIEKSVPLDRFFDNRS